MTNIIRPIPFQKLIQWIFEEYKQHQTIFGIPEVKFFRKNSKSHITIFGEMCETPVGPAAGPHTQLSQNIIASYITGARFFELKTVQKLDNLEIEKPCIDAEDEGYNTEWSTELTITQAYNEYVKAWFIIHLLQKLFHLSLFEKKAFIFNMSIGYNLEGIRTSKVDNFIEGLKNASNNVFFNECKDILRDQIKDQKLIEIDEIFIDSISPNISNSITLSTMHGCPPEEIEAICKYLIEYKGLHTYVKLNPILLGYKTVRNILDNLGYGYIQLKEEAFTNDLQYNDAIVMINRLKSFAEEHNREFGVKLSNTLLVANFGSELQGDEMYMSGRALFPLTINLASMLASEFDGNINISYSGGVSFFNISKIFETGIKPITLVTDLLKPGGYLRLNQLANELEPYLERAKGEKIDVKKLKELAENSIKDTNYFKSKRYTNNLKINKELPLFDCFIAPCIESCPIQQDIPEYIRLINEKRYFEAFKLIVSKNPLPHITGYICDHKCMLKCVRNDYDDPILIRDLKRIVAENSYKDFIERFHNDVFKNDVKVAIIGAGPSGLSAGYFLAKAGFDVTIFDKREKPGGTVQYVIPTFRLPRWAIENDINLIKKMGVKFQLSINEEFSVNKLKEQGYKYIYLAIGAGKSSPLKLNGKNKNVYDAIEFLESFNIDMNKIKLGKKIVVIGGGNSAMDSARAAMRVKGVEKVYIIYRRIKEYMPADREEFDNALSEGVVFKELLFPVEFSNNILKCQKMKLGKQDKSGRKRPIPIEDEFAEIQVDSVISAIGEFVDAEILKKNGINLNDKQVEFNNDTLETNIENVYIGGDALRGPSTVVESIADGNKVANVIIEKEKIKFKNKSSNSEIIFDDDQRISEITLKKGIIQSGEKQLSNQKEIEREAGRCLECNFICNKCVEVCPNRANIAIGISHEFTPLDSIPLYSIPLYSISLDSKHLTGQEHLTGQARTFTNYNYNNIYQIIHIDGMCNECGNCATFCPYENGKPYKEKFTIFWEEEDFSNSKNSGFILKNYESLKFRIRLDNKIYDIKFNDDGEIISGISSFNDELSNVLKFIWKVYKNYKYLLLKNLELS